ncbi:hypothetical protein IKF04_01735 [Candidatus Saccharibacteria bacterium]|nr:hypothetical protein [Candidatus Saccharibacteria bacterium]
MKQDGHLIGTPTKDALDCGPGNTSKDSGTHTPSREEIFQAFEEMYNPELSLELTEGVTISPASCQAAYRYAIWRYACEVAETMKHCQGKDKKYGELRFYSWALSQLWAGKPKQYLSDHIEVPSTLPVSLLKSTREEWLLFLMEKMNAFQSELNDFAATITWDELVAVIDGNYAEVVATILDKHGFRIDSTDEYRQSSLEMARAIIDILAIKNPRGKEYRQLRKVVFNRLSTAINIFAFARLATIAMRGRYEEERMIPVAIQYAIRYNKYDESINEQIRQMDHAGQKTLVAFILEHGPERLDIRFNPPIVWAVLGSGAIHVHSFCSCINGSFHPRSTWNSSTRFGSDKRCFSLA